MPPSTYEFRHGAFHRVQNAREASAGRQGLGHDSVWLICSYHPSQQNTLTGRLTPGMFDRVWKKATELSRRA